MAEFRYKAISASGTVTGGRMEASSADAVIDRLQGQGFLPIEARETGAGFDGLVSRLRRWRGGTSKNDLAILTRELSRLVGAGVTLERSFEILIDITESRKLRDLLAAILASIRRGATLSDAMGEQGKLFDRLYVNMVRAGEAGGALGAVLARLADHMAWMRELRATITSALTYPFILMAVAILAISIILTKVVPQFEELLSGSSAALPWATVFVIELSQWYQAYWWLPFAVLLVVLLGGMHLARSPAVRAKMDRLVLRLPVIGKYVLKIETARFCRTLGTLLAGGIGLLDGLLIAGQTIGNRTVADSVAGAAQDLKSGSGLAQALQDRKVFPRLATHLMRVGEETGRLDELLADAAKLFEDDIRNNTKRMLSLLEPLLITILGLVIGGIMVSVLLGIFSINDLAF